MIALQCCTFIVDLQAVAARWPGGLVGWLAERPHRRWEHDGQLWRMGGSMGSYDDAREIEERSSHGLGTSDWGLGLETRLEPERGAGFSGVRKAGTASPIIVGPGLWFDRSTGERDEW